jgi:hypothetical protein
MYTSKLSRLGAEVIELTTQPELGVIKRRARHRRIRRQAFAGAGIVLAVSLTGIAAWQVLPLAPGSTSHPAGLSLRPSDQTPDAPGRLLAWAGAGDANHLYAELSPCEGSSPAGIPACDVELIGSDDAGKHWDVRQDIKTGMLVRGPTTLVAPATGPKEGSQPMRVSIDGGRSWQSVTTDNTPQAKVPAGGWLDCDSETDVTSIPLFPQQSCFLRAVDPIAHTIRPLAPPPGITPAMAAPVPANAGLWVLGMDSDKNATASVSRDGGITWSTHHFGVPPTDPSPTVDPSSTAAPLIPNPDPHAYNGIQISTFDGRTVNAVLTFRPYAYGFRSTDGGRTWQPTDGGKPLPTMTPDYNPAVTLPDGTHVLQDDRDDHPIVWFSQPPDARSYVQGNARAGWSSLSGGAMMGADGHLVGRDAYHIWLSTNGTSWRKITPG